MAKYDPKLLEEELKNKVAANWFAAYDTTRIIGKVDFCVAIPATELGLYKAEKITFLPFDAVQDVFAQNDFNWNVPPSYHESKEFAQFHAVPRTEPNQQRARREPLDLVCGG